MVDMSAYPVGNVTFVFTDIEGSSRMTSELEQKRIGTYEEKLRDPHRLRLLELAGQHDGHEIHRAGDGHLLVFQFAEKALACAVAFQQSLHDNPIIHTEDGKPHTIKVRVGIHTALVQRKLTMMENGLPEYPGGDTNYAARIGSLGIGGQIIVSQATYQLARQLRDYEQPPCAVQPWPGRFLKSFPGPHNVYELLYYAGQEPFEPGMRWFAEWYRSERNRFVDRREKEKDVFAGFDSRGVRLVTITGIGGTGKTRLAIACAAKRADLYDDGIYFVSLATADLVENPQAVNTSRNAAFVAQTIGAALELTEGAAEPEPLFQWLRTKNLLLVLDNYESVRCQGVGQYLIKLATETAGVSLLVTGREPINVGDMEKRVNLNDGMTDGEARDLFLDRARLKEKLKGELTPEQETQLGRILDLTERIPLALEFAAAWIERKSLRQIAEEIEATPLGPQSEAVGLRADDTIAFQRHRSLERSLAWSYNLLDPAAQRVLATISLFADTFDSATLEAVHGSDGAADGLYAIQNASLVYQDSNPQLKDEYRFRLHRATRAYAAGRLDKLPSAVETRRRFVAYYRQLVTDNDNLNEAKQRAVLTTEWQNGLAAVSVAETIEDWSSVLLLSNLGSFLDLRGMWLEQERLYLSSLAAAKASGNRQGEGQMLNNLGVVYQSRGQWDKAEQAYGQDLRICRELGDRQGEGSTLNNLGNVYQDRGEWDKAEQAYGESLVIRRELGDRQGEGSTLNNLGVVYQSRGQWDKAEQAYGESLVICCELEDRQGEGQTLNNLGVVYQSRGQWDKAEQAYGQDLRICRELGDRQGEGQTLGNIAGLMQAQGKRSEAIACMRQAVTVLEQTEDAITLAKAQEMLKAMEGA